MRKGRRNKAWNTQDHLPPLHHLPPWHGHLLSVTLLPSGMMTLASSTKYTKCLMSACSVAGTVLEANKTPSCPQGGHYSALSMKKNKRWDVRKQKELGEHSNDREAFRESVTEPGQWTG